MKVDVSRDAAPALVELLADASDRELIKLRERLEYHLGQAQRKPLTSEELEAMIAVVEFYCAEKPGLGIGRVEQAKSGVEKLRGFLEATRRKETINGAQQQAARDTSPETAPMRGRRWEGNGAR